ncbi:MAG: hypothetical protein AVDCRST_MAG40-90, partial [uncultured Gemmatimonadaceae bacterium]
AAPRAPPPAIPPRRESRRPASCRRAHRSPCGRRVGRARCPRPDADSGRADASRPGKDRTPYPRPAVRAGRGDAVRRALRPAQGGAREPSRCWRRGGARDAGLAPRLQAPGRHTVLPRRRRVRELGRHHHPALPPVREAAEGGPAHPPRAVRNLPRRQGLRRGGEGAPAHGRRAARRRVVPLLRAHGAARSGTELLVRSLLQARPQPGRRARGAPRADHHPGGRVRRDRRPAGDQHERDPRQVASHRALALRRRAPDRAPRAVASPLRHPDDGPHLVRARAGDRAAARRPRGAM